ncbi:AsmA family protein [Vibrio sp. S4M6]|uniref:AsmA family protein n=1 Tax=Vibrio sinus TaxID=2946865 RepID=UPI00202A8246|nr:AsmA family protein [Vibrio sinus]MCL9780305.1 AsmA family protein [Vibrio sinus]
MGKLAKIVIALVCLLLLLVAILYGLLYTKLATPIVNTFLYYTVSQNVTAQTVVYQSPWKFELSGVTTKLSKGKAYIPKVTVWLNPDLIHNGKIVLDSVLVDGLSLQGTMPEFSFSKHFFLYQIAFHNLDFSAKEFVARDLDLQIDKPVWHPGSVLPYGKIQLSADQIYYQGQALDKVLVNADYNAKDSTIYGASFTWHGASVSGQAEQYAQGWSLVNLTISKLNLSQDEETDKLKQVLRQLAAHIHHINSLDILNSVIQYGDWTFNNLDASAEDLLTDRSLWQQPKGYLSFNADSIDYKNLQFVQPSAQFYFSPNKINLAEFDTDFEQGRIKASADFTPNSANFSLLHASGIKWSTDASTDLSWLSSAIPPLDKLVIQQMDVENSQFIQLTDRPFWQLSGLSFEGTNMELVKDGRWGLWDGQFQASASSASYGDLIASQAIVQTHAKQGNWSLDRLLIPLKNGYISATGNWDIGSSAEPWALSVNADGVPIGQHEQWPSLPFELDGTLELAANLHGMAKSQSLFNYSFSGDATANLRHATLSQHHQVDGQTRSLVLPLEIDNVVAKSDRGRITLTSKDITGPGIQGKLDVDIDLTAPNRAKANLSIVQKCEDNQLNLVTGDIESTKTCKSKGKS